MPFKFTSDKTDKHVVITKDSYDALKLMDLSLKRAIEDMNRIVDTWTTFHFTMSQVLVKIKETDPTIDDDVLE